MKIWQTVPVVLLMWSMLGCSKVNQNNYDQLEVGSSFETVQGLLGKPKNCDDQMGTKSCAWGDDKRFIRGTFVADKLVLYSGEGL